MKKIDFAGGLELPIEAVTQTFAFLARRGAGKTYGASKLAEGMLDAGAQVVVLDPIGNWYGLRIAADGKKKGFAIPVFGGLHGDVPLEATAGALIADLVVDRELSVVLDVSGFRKGDRKRFATDFAEQLFHRKKSSPSPLHVFVEEAQAFVPQRVQADEARMLGAFEDIIRQGRNFGLGATLISQRPQSVNKEVLSQTEVLVVLQVNEAQARKALREWIVEAGLDVGELVDTLPSLKRGEAWVWSPAWLGVTKRVHIGKKKTLDASATPEVGAKRVEPRELAPVDLEALSAAMAETLERAKENDPKLLQKRVRELERELEKRPEAKPQRIEVKVPVLVPEHVKAFEELGGALLRLLRDVHQGIQACAPGKPFVPVSIGYQGPQVKHVAKSSQAARDLLGAWPEPKPGAARQIMVRALKDLRRPSREVEKEDSPSLKRGAREMLSALVQMSPLTRAQLGTWVVLPPNGSTFGTYLSQLKRAGLVEEASDGLRPTETGKATAGDVPPPPSTTEQLVAFWGSKVKAGARAMLEVLVDAHPQDVSRDYLSNCLVDRGFNIPAAGSTFGTYLSTLRRNGLVEVLPAGFVRASDTLFLRAPAA